MRFIYGKNFLEKIKKIKKEQWFVLFLAGVLLIIIAIPIQKPDTVKPKEQKELRNQPMEQYVMDLEKRTEQLLHSMEGVGSVQVMITLKNNGASVVEKDVTKNRTQDEQKEQGARESQSTSDAYSEETVYENQTEGTPMIVSEQYPQVEGVVVVAEGCGNSDVEKNILDALEALFSIEIHKIKVVKKAGGK